MSETEDNDCIEAFDLKQVPRIIDELCTLQASLDKCSLQERDWFFLFLFSPYFLIIMIFHNAMISGTYQVNKI